MEKTTVYLTTEQKQALTLAAKLKGRSEARLIRDGIESVTARHRAAEPTVALTGEPRPDPIDPTVDLVRRPRWVSGGEFVARVAPHPADPGLRDELRRLADGTTDDIDVQ